MSKTWKEVKGYEWSITEVCRGNRHTAYGYLWRYANQDIVREN